MAKKGKKKNSKKARRSNSGGGGEKKRSNSKRSRGSGGSSKRKTRRREPEGIDKLSLSGLDVAIAVGTAIGATLLNRASVKAVKEAGGDEAKANYGWWRKLNVVKQLGTVGNLGAASTGLALATDLPYVKGVAAGFDALAFVQYANRGGLYKKETPSTEQGQLLVAGDDRLALGGEVLSERVDVMDA